MVFMLLGTAITYAVIILILSIIAGVFLTIEFCLSLILRN